MAKKTGKKTFTDSVAILPQGQQLWSRQKNETIMLSLLSNIRALDSYTSNIQALHRTTCRTRVPSPPDCWRRLCRACRCRVRENLRFGAASSRKWRRRCGWRGRDRTPVTKVKLLLRGEGRVARGNLFSVKNVVCKPIYLNQAAKNRW